MRITSKVLSVVLVMCMLFTTIGFSATYSDVSIDNANYPAVSLLSSLGIIKGYEDGTFGPDKNVTRAEFTVMLIRTLNMSGIGSSDPAGLPFEDVDSVDWAISDIRTAYDLGIINGMSETQFAPNEQVTSEQALKMIICAMGYEPMAIEIAGGKEFVWPAGYTTVAGQLNITAGITSAMNAPAKRAEIARYIYNALEVDLMVSTEYANGAVKTEIKQGRNILNDKLKVLYGTGELLADNDSSAMESGTLSREGEVVIYQEDVAANDTFYINGISTTGLVGRSIKYYYKEDYNGLKTLVYIEDRTKSSSVLKIDPEMLDDVDGSWSSGVEISYWANDDDRNVTTVELGAHPTVSINGRVIDTNDYTPDEAILIDSGSIELVDAANSGSYNKINIISYQTYVVSSISTSEHLVIDMFRTTATGKNLELNEDDNQTTLTITRASNNSTSSLSSLSKYDVLSVKESNGANGKKVIEVIVSKDKVSGTVNSIDLEAKLITINGKDYKLSNYILNYADTQISQLEINDTCDFYLDKDGKIAAYEKTESTNTSYAYICGVIAGSDVSTFRIIDSTGARISVNGASRVKIDGESISNPEDVVSRLDAAVDDNADGNKLNASQLVKITKNSAGAISAIDTISENANPSETDLVLTLSGTDFTYDASNKKFSNGTDSFMVDSSTIIFEVPTTRTSYTDYAKRPLSYFKDDRTYTGIHFEVYDKGEKSTDKAKCVVFYGSGGAEKLAADSSILIVNSVGTANNPYYGQSAKRINGYLFGANEQNGTDAVTKLTTDSDALSGLGIGNVYRVAYSESEYYNSYSKKLISVTGDMGDSFYKEGVDGDVDEDYVAVYGLLVGADGDTFVIADTNDVDDLINGNSVDEYTYTVNSDTIFVKYDASKSDDYKLSATTDNIIESMPSFDGTKEAIETDENGEIISTSGVTASEIFAYIVDGDVMLVYQIIR